MLDAQDLIKEIENRFEQGDSRGDVMSWVSELGLSVELEVEAETYIAQHSNGNSEFNLTDLGNSERLVHEYTGQIHFVIERGIWVVWDGKHWVDDGTGLCMRKLAQKVVRNIYIEAANTEEKEKRDKLAAHAKASEASARIEAMLKEARAMGNIPITVNRFDNNHLLLNVNNGTIDLKTGELKPHNSSDLITKLIKIDYNHDAASELWDKVVSDVFEGNQNIIDYYQRAKGYSITGLQTEIAFFFNYGTGANGKTTIEGAIRDVLDGYAAEVDPAAFMVVKGQTPGPNEQIASLYKTRLCVATELEDGQRLSVSLVKRMTGGESLRCERKYEHGFSFKPEYKLWLSGNHEPTITDTTSSIWNRLKKIPFKAYFPPESRINGLREMLVAENKEAILAWLVKGCLEWQKQGLNEPSEIKAAVQAYRDAQDILHDFLGENCIVRINEKVSVKELYKAYTDWATNNDVPAITKNKFRDRLIERGLFVTPGHANQKEWNGLRLLTNDEKVTLVTQVTLFPEKSSIRELYKKVPEKSTTKVTKITNVETSDKFLSEKCGVCGDENPVAYGTSFACGTCHPELLNESLRD